MWSSRVWVSQTCHVTQSRTPSHSALPFPAPTPENILQSTLSPLPPQPLLVDYIATQHTRARGPAKARNTLHAMDPWYTASPMALCFPHPGALSKAGDSPV